MSETDCLAKSGGDVRVRLPSEVEIEEMTPVGVTFPEGMTLTQAWVEGVNMYMGRTVVEFAQQTATSATGTFFLGACSQPRMQWRLVLEFTSPEMANTLTHDYYFETTAE